MSYNSKILLKFAITFNFFVVSIVSKSSNLINVSTLTKNNEHYNYENSIQLRKEWFECSEFFCKNITCRPIINCDNGEIVQKASLCGCCDKCITYKGENETCDGNLKIPLGGQAKVKCKLGLTCKKGICERYSKESCYIIGMRRNFMKNIENDHASNISYSRELWIPDCKYSGKFKAKQCKSKKCICVDENGQTLFGQEETDLAQNMTCNCARAMNALRNLKPDTWMTKTQEHCTKTGDFKKLQCVGDLCYCADPITGQILGRITKKQFIAFLPCYNKATIGNSYETQCDLELIRTRSIRYQFYRKNITIVGLEHQECDLDGTYKAKQCSKDKCVCTDRNGLGIKSYYIERLSRIEEITMKCNCARDENDNEALHTRYPKMKCTGKGNFERLQCFETDNCYCVDEDGDILTERISQKSVFDQNLCELYLNNLMHDV